MRVAVRRMGFKFGGGGRRSSAGVVFPLARLVSNCHWSRGVGK